LALSGGLLQPNPGRAGGSAKRAARPRAWLRGRGTVPLTRRRAVKKPTVVSYEIRLSGRGRQAGVYRTRGESISRWQRASSRSRSTPC